MSDGVTSGVALREFVLEAVPAASPSSLAWRWDMVRDLAVCDLINAETVGKLLDITTEQAERLVAGWRESANKCPECGQSLDGAAT